MTQIPAIYRCPRCRKAGRPDTHRIVYKREQKSLGLFVFTDPSGIRYPTRYADGVPGIVCPQEGCGRELFTRPVVGKVTADKCGAKCLAAKGHTCDCSCGGQNHGANY